MPEDRALADAYAGLTGRQRRTVSVETDSHSLGYMLLGYSVARELDGMWRRKDGGGINFSFSLTLVEHAGGILRLLSEWERYE